MNFLIKARKNFCGNNEEEKSYMNLITFFLCKKRKSNHIKQTFLSAKLREHICVQEHFGKPKVCFNLFGETKDSHVFSR